jgi:hypothetical protein
MTLLPYRGFAALLPVLIISIVLLTLSVGAATSSYLVRLEALEAEHAAQSRADAYACAQAALFERAADASYVPHSGGDEVWLTDTRSCRIEQITRTGARHLLIVHGEYRGFRTVLEIIFEERPERTPPFVIISFRKI